VLHCQSTAVPSSTSIKPADLLVARVTPSPDDGPDRGREQITRYKDRTRLFQKGDVFPGVTAIPCPGHTPGHTSFLISSGNEQLLIWGDTVHVPEIQTARPEVCMEFDTDPDAAAVTRWRVSTGWRLTGCRSLACTCISPASLISCAAALAISSFPKRGSRLCKDDGTAAARANH
jgi:hypothetical protein